MSNPSQQRSSLMSPSRRTLIALATAYALAGISAAYLSDSALSGRAFTFALGAVTTIAIYIWCKQEAAERNAFPPGRSALWAALFPPVLLPVYFFRTRPPGAAIRLSFKAYAAYVGLLVIAVVGSVVAVVISQLLEVGRGA